MKRMLRSSSILRRLEDWQSGANPRHRDTCVIVGDRDYNATRLPNCYRLRNHVKVIRTGNSKGAAIPEFDDVHEQVTRGQEREREGRRDEHE